MTSLEDGPPAPEGGWIHAVNERDPPPTALKTSTAECRHCGADIAIGRESFVVAEARLYTQLGDTETRHYADVRLCDWVCWESWASR